MAVAEWDLFGAAPGGPAPGGPAAPPASAPPAGPAPWARLLPDAVAAAATEAEPAPAPETAAAEGEPAELPFGRRPAYVSPAVALRAGVPGRGGGRGFFAARAVAPGELLLEERACLPTPSAHEAERGRLPIEVLAVAGLRGVAGADRAALLRDLAHLYPFALDDLEAEFRDAHRAQYVGAAEALAGELGLPADEVLRLICVTKMNAFSTGWYLSFAMLNHACRPNCTKLSRGGGASQLRAARPIRAGEELTVNYLDQLSGQLMVNPHRRARLKRQFAFDCDCALCRPTLSAACRPLEQRGAEGADNADTEVEVERLHSFLFQAEEELHLLGPGAPAAALEAVLAESLAQKRALCPRALGPRSFAVLWLTKLVARACGALLEAGSTAATWDAELRAAVRGATGGGGEGGAAAEDAEFDAELGLLELWIASLVEVREAERVLLGPGAHLEAVPALEDLAEALGRLQARGLADQRRVSEALGPGLVDPARGFTLSKFQAAVWRSARAVAEAYGGGWGE